MFENIILFNDKACAGLASNTLALSNPIPPVLQDLAAMGADARRRGGGGGTNRGRMGRGGGSGWQRVFDPQNRGRARRP